MPPDNENPMLRMSLTVVTTARGAPWGPLYSAAAPAAPPVATPTPVETTVAPLMQDHSHPATSSPPSSSRATSNTATRNTIPAMNSMYPPVKAFVIDDETKPLATWLGLSPRVTLVSNTAPTKVSTT